MVILNFTITPEAASKIHDLLICLGKFSDTVAIEARRDRFTFTALNSSKSAYAALSLDSQHFFTKYECTPDHGGSDGRFTCSMYTKALLSVFKGRLYDPLGRDGSIDRCEVNVQDRAGETQCRFIIKMICNQGVIKTYKLMYEAVDVMHALFDRSAARNRWCMQASAMREYIEYFGTKTDMLDIFAGEDGRAIFKSYTEKISNGKEILRHPLVTAVAVNTSDFGEFNVQPGLHIIISVRDFKAIVAHADTLKTSLKAFYSQPTRPFQFNYSTSGISCEFTLMTSGDHSASTTASTPAPNVSHRSSMSRSASTTTERRASHDRMMPPPAEPASRRTVRRQPAPAQVAATTTKPTVEVDSDSLFVGHEEEEDMRWEPVDHDKEEETLGWDASAHADASHFQTFRDSGSFSRHEAAVDGASMEAIAPSQRVSQVQGLW